MHEAIDVAFDIFWALVFTVVVCSALGTLALLGLLGLLAWVLNCVRRSHESATPQDEHLPADDFDSLRLRTADPTWKEAA